MSTAPERQANNARVAELVLLAANGKPAAREYLFLLARAARLADDLIDGDVQQTPEARAELIGLLFVQLPGNAFYRAHAEALTALHAVVWNAWLDSNGLARRTDPTDRAYAHVLRDLINEVLAHVALLTGGYGHMRHVSSEMRQAFRKPLADLDSPLSPPDGSGPTHA